MSLDTSSFIMIKDSQPQNISSITKQPQNSFFGQTVLSENSALLEEQRTSNIAQHIIHEVNEEQQIERIQQPLRLENRTRKKITATCLVAFTAIGLLYLHRRRNPLKPQQTPPKEWRVKGKRTLTITPKAQ